MISSLTSRIIINVNSFVALMGHPAIQCAVMHGHWRWPI